MSNEETQWRNQCLHRQSRVWDDIEPIPQDLPFTFRNLAIGLVLVTGSSFGWWLYDVLRGALQ